MFKDLLELLKIWTVVSCVQFLQDHAGCDGCRTTFFKFRLAVQINKNLVLIEFEGCNQFKLLKVKNLINLARFCAEECSKLLYYSLLCVLVN